MRTVTGNFLLVLAVLLAPSLAFGLSATSPKDTSPVFIPDELKDIGIDEKQGDTLPLDATFRDTAGKTVRLGDLINGKPTILQLGYFECPMLCTLVAEGWVKSVREIPMHLGDDYQVISISVNPNETPKAAATKKKNFIKGLEKPINEAAVHFLVGDPPSIEAVTQATGFKYKYVEATRQYSHPAVITIVSPKGRIAQYIYGVRYDAGEVTAALNNAKAEKTASSLQQFAMTCLQLMKGDSNALFYMRIGGIVTVLGIVTALSRMFYLEYKRRKNEPETETPASGASPAVT